MLYLGTNIRQAGDSLTSVAPFALFEMVSNPSGQLRMEVESLRVMKQIDASAYRNAKCNLPYFVCSHFSPLVRKGENFVYAEYFIMDIDHICSIGREVSELRTEIEADERVLLSYLSPGGDGLKIVFKISEKCYDPAVFKVFYREFVSRFAAQYAIREIVDRKTCDPTRASFLSVDSNAFYRDTPCCVRLSDYLELDNPDDFFSMKRNQDLEEDSHSADGEPEQFSGPSDDDLEKIKDILAVRKNKIIRRTECYVPDILNRIIGDVMDDLMSNAVSVNDVYDIQYGKKLCLEYTGKYAELNVFYGKRGFSVVPSPKRGTDAALNDLMAEWVRTYLALRDGKTA